METRVAVSIVIPSYRPRDTIRECIRSLLNQTIGRDSYEIIIVDCSEDTYVFSVLEDFDGVYIVHVGRWLNVGDARNLGAALSRGKIIAFTDTDCIPPPDWLERILADFSEYPEVCGVLGVYSGGRTVLEKISGGELMPKHTRVGFFKGFIEGNCAFIREVFEKNCRWSSSSRFECRELAICVEKYVMKPLLWDPRLKVLHRGRVTFKSLMRSGESKFRDIDLREGGVWKNFVFAAGMATSIFLGGLSILNTTLAIPLLSYIAILSYYVSRDPMVELKYKLLYLPYLIIFRIVYWLGWLYASIKHICGGTRYRYISSGRLQILSPS